MTTTIYKFEQGRLLVHEERKVERNYIGSGGGIGIPVRIGHIRTIEEVLSVTTDYDKYGLVTPLSEVKTSGDEIFVVMRRGDGTSGTAAVGYMSGITSGLNWLAELTSGELSGFGGNISNKVTVIADILGY